MRKAEAAVRLETWLKDMMHLVCPRQVGRTVRLFWEAGRVPSSCPPLLAHNHKARLAEVIPAKTQGVSESSGENTSRSGFYVLPWVSTASPPCLLEEMLGGEVVYSSGEGEVRSSFIAYCCSPPIRNIATLKRKVIFKRCLFILGMLSQ